MNTRTVVCNGPALAQFVSADTKTVGSIIRSGEFFRFVADRELWEPPSDGLEGYAYWSEVHRSGLYASAEDALAAAMQELPWLSKATPR